MDQVWFCSDLHFGHQNIQKFRDFVKSEEDNRNYIIESWKRLVGKRDTVYVLGDACFTMETVHEFFGLPGKRFLVRGNHDLLNTEVYSKIFHEVYGLLKYKEFWLSHAPIHPQELRGRVNLHGHVHYSSVRPEFNPLYHVTEQPLDKRYFNCCVENLRDIVKEPLISLDQLRKLLGKDK